MKNNGQIKSEDIQFRDLLGQYLKLKVSRSSFSPEGRHLEEDMVAAFVEGNLAQREAQPIVKHLIDCSFCRQITTELVKLDFALADEEIIPAVVNDEKPSKVSEVLSGLLSRIFGTSDGAVFAHQEKEENSQEIEHSEEIRK